VKKTGVFSRKTNEEFLPAAWNIWQKIRLVAVEKFKGFRYNVLVHN
jgi:hypothetical protein